MEQEKNLISITGYLKENTLEQCISKAGKKAIRGNLIIATNSLESHRIQFYASETTSTGVESKDYQKLLKVLPENTTTIASYLAANPGADFETAAKASTKVWARGSLDEFTRRNDKGEEITLIQLKGRCAGIKDESASFEPKARFEVEVYISDLVAEKTPSGEETGRYKLTGLIQNYDQSVSKIDFIAPTQNNVATYIASNYSVSDTVHINGNLVNIMNRVLIKAANENHFGIGGHDQYETTFVNERVIDGGDATSIHEGQEGSISKNAVKIGLAKREGKISTNTNKPEPTPAAPVTPRANFGKSNDFEEVDF